MAVQCLERCACDQSKFLFIYLSLSNSINILLLLLLKRLSKSLQFMSCFFFIVHNVIWYRCLLLRIFCLTFTLLAIVSIFISINYMYVIYKMHGQCIIRIANVYKSPFFRFLCSYILLFVSVFLVLFYFASVNN